MPQSLFVSNLMSNVYDNAALPYLFLNYCESLKGKQYSRNNIKKLMAESPTIEHILSQHPIFSLSSAGFQNKTDFDGTDHHIEGILPGSKKDSTVRLATAIPLRRHRPMIIHNDTEVVI